MTEIFVITFSFILSFVTRIISAIGGHGHQRAVLSWGDYCDAGWKVHGPTGAGKELGF
jgi:hypothetical protein